MSSAPTNSQSNPDPSDEMQKLAFNVELGTNVTANILPWWFWLLLNVSLAPLIFSYFPVNSTWRDVMQVVHWIGVITLLSASAAVVMNYPDFSSEDKDRDEKRPFKSSSFGKLFFSDVLFFRIILWVIVVAWSWVALSKFAQNPLDTNLYQFSFGVLIIVLFLYLALRLLLTIFGFMSMVLRWWKSRKIQTARLSKTNDVKMRLQRFSKEEIICFQSETNRRYEQVSSNPANLYALLAIPVSFISTDPFIKQIIKPSLELFGVRGDDLDRPAQVIVTIVFFLLVVSAAFSVARVERDKRIYRIILDSCDRLMRDKQDED